MNYQLEAIIEKIMIKKLEPIVDLLKLVQQSVSEIKETMLTGHEKSKDTIINNLGKKSEKNGNEQKEKSIPKKVSTQPIINKNNLDYWNITNEFEIDISEKKGKELNFKIEYTGNIPLFQNTTIMPEIKPYSLLTFEPIIIKPDIIKNRIKSISIPIKFASEVSLEPEKELIEIVDLKIINSEINLNQLVSLEVKITNKKNYTWNYCLQIMSNERNIKKKEIEEKERVKTQRRGRESDFTIDKKEEIINKLDENYNVNSIFTREAIESAIEQAGGDYEKTIEILFN